MNTEAMKQQAREALELAEKATPGPWHQDARFPETVESRKVGYICYAEYQNNGWDAAFIASSRTLVPDLARAVLELAAEVEQERHLHQQANEELADMVNLWTQAKDEVERLKAEVEALRDQTRTGRYLEANAEERLKAVISLPVIEENKRLAHELDLHRGSLRILRSIAETGEGELNGSAPEEAHKLEHYIRRFYNDL